ncbi:MULTISPECIES: hypothetical protein [unclassified Fibrobacter]|uniref:hypothetical protein n=1 Tax=unclassified Fibrobacter TaxID=2634177 RepID=UPI000D6D5829|nr:MULTISPECIES: hypothetical protein [unclassified Fibrobacter]
MFLARSSGTFLDGAANFNGKIENIKTYISKLINQTISTKEIQLPIMLDSPSGKEVDRDDIQLMINVLKRDFSDHQIIVASIYNYSGFDNANVIEIKNRLVE